MSNDNSLEQIRHSCAHLLAAAVMELYPNAKRTIGPAIESGFYYDFDFGDVKISDEELPKIEEKMRELVKTWNGFEREEVSVDEAKKRMAGNEYKLELIEEFSTDGQTLSIYKSGSFEDLCRGGHSENPQKDLAAFKLLSLAGAYWRGNEKNKMLTRIYGTAFSSQKELDEYLNQQEEARKRDHRKLGKELDLFVFSDLVGPGLPLFTPKGTILRDELGGFSQGLQQKYGYQRVAIPHMARVALYKTSGHYDKYPERFTVTSHESDDEFMMKPMNCPHHSQIYASKPRSYRDLPIRYMENTMVYRDEKAGELHGLSRVRAATQDDAHVFCTMDQIEEEFTSIMAMIKELYGTLGMTFRARLSFRDNTDKYLGDIENWNKAQQIIEDVAKKLELEYFIGEGEAAFYGPKIDVMVRDAIGREHQCATEQLDFVQPSRFGLVYTDADGSEKTPVMIHKALLGSIERFLAVYIEHTAGAFPTWMAPVQAVMIPIADRHAEYAQKLAAELRAVGVRVDVDARSESMQSKIRDAQMQKVPYMYVMGDKEIESQGVAVRKRGGENLGLKSFEEVKTALIDEIQRKV